MKRNPRVASMTRFVAALFAVSFCMSSALARADGYPDHQIRLVVPYGPGGVTDIIARAVAPAIAQVLGGSIFIDNRPGGSTMIGTELVVRSKPDGYTLLFDSGGALSANPSLFKKMPYDTAKDIAPVSMVAVVPYVLAVANSLPVNSPQEFITLAKTKPGGLNYSSAGNGSGNHLTAELFMEAAAIKAQHIPYKSGGEMVTALLTNQVSFTLAALPSALSAIKGNTIKVLAVTTLQPSPALPGIPTLDSAGVKGFNVTEWLGLFAPVGTPPDIITKLNATTNKALQSPELREKLTSLGADASGGPPEALDKIFRSDLTRWAAVAKEINFELQ